jgi:uncharacterized repeat protein (TIGR01451 family)
MYADLAQAYDPESGAVAGTFYESGTIPAYGSTVADSTLGKVFIYGAGGAEAVQIFSASAYGLPGSSTIALNLQDASSATRLTRWGANGLAVRSPVAVSSVRSNLVADLSAVSADLGLTFAVSGTNVTGSRTTFTATITNAGPTASTNVALSGLLPNVDTMVSAVPSAGSCSIGVSEVTCDVGGLASGATTTVAFGFLDTTAGSLSFTAQVVGSENDPNLYNNTTTATATVSGSGYALAPVVSAVTPSGIEAGAGATQILVAGANFTSGSVVMVNGTAVPTTVSGSNLYGMVPASMLASLGSDAVTVMTPGPGGGTSGAVALSVFSVIKAGADSIVYDPYSRNIVAGIGGGGGGFTANSLAVINPQTGAVSAQVPIGGGAATMSLTSDGQILYGVVPSGTGANVVRFNMLTDQVEASLPAPGYTVETVTPPIATLPGTENSYALNVSLGAGLFDYNPATRTAALRGGVTSAYSAGTLQFLDAGHLLTGSGSGSLGVFTVSSSGLSATPVTTELNDFYGPFKLSGGMAFASTGGGVARVSDTAVTAAGVFPGVYTNSTYLASTPRTMAADAFQLANLQQITSPTFVGAVQIDSIESFSTTSFLPVGYVNLNMEAIEGTANPITVLDLIRWGQDGLAEVTSSGNIYLVKGAFVVPQELNQNSAAVLTGSSATTIAHGSGNTLLTLTGSNFVPGVGVSWNGSYRTTTIVSPTQVTVAIPASDLANVGTGVLVATNPGAGGSASIAVMVI